MQIVPQIVFDIHIKFPLKDNVQFFAIPHFWSVQKLQFVLRLLSVSVIIFAASASATLYSLQIRCTFSGISPCIKTFSTSSRSFKIKSAFLPMITQLSFSAIFRITFLCASYTISSTDFPVISRPENAQANKPFFGDNSTFSRIYSGENPDCSAICPMISLS